MGRRVHHRGAGLAGRDGPPHLPRACRGADHRGSRSADRPRLEDADARPTSAATSRSISTDAKPDPAFYQTSVADALAAHKPFLLVFATPKFCASAQCGPTLEQIKPIAAAHPEVTFINVEPYQLE